MNTRTNFRCFHPFLLKTKISELPFSGSYTLTSPNVKLLVSTSSGSLASTDIYAIINHLSTFNLYWSKLETFTPAVHQKKDTNISMDLSPKLNKKYFFTIYIYFLFNTTHSFCSVCCRYVHRVLQCLLHFIPMCM